MLVQKLRLQRGWSQQQLAVLSGLNVRTIQRIENGQPASTETLKSLASVFEIDFNQLSSGEPDMNNPASSSSYAHFDAKRDAEERQAFRHVRRLKGFYAQLAMYVLVIGLLAFINLTTTSRHIWFVWPALGWGLSLAIQAIYLWSPFFGADWEKRQVEKRLGRPL
jgi:transcriptional regulator with XRE-family HTH domain